MPGAWISTAEAAEILGVSAQTVRRRVADGKIEAFRTKPPDKGWRKVSRASVEAYRAEMLGGEPTGGTPDGSSTPGVGG